MMIYVMRQMEESTLEERRIRAAAAEAEEYRRNHPRDEEDNSDAETLVLERE